MVKSLSRALLRSSSLIILISSSVTLSSAAFANDPLEVVVTADRSEVPLKNTGSAITVITSEEIEKYGSKNIADVLRTVPGVTVAEAGGLGGATKAQLRGSSPGASMILLDGVRISDPSNTEGFFDFGNFSAANIERIEIVRGPQSALYGSDAMGGVINIITKKGKRTPMREATVEAGSYGTINARGFMSGATEKTTYSFGLNALHSAGFPRYGYRSTNSNIFPYLGFGAVPDDGSDPKPINDPTTKSGLNGRVAHQLNDDVKIETGLFYFSNDLQFDNPYAYYARNVYDPYNFSKASILNGYMKGYINNFDGALQSQISVFGNKTSLSIRQREGCFYPYDPDDNRDPFDCTSGYIGQRAGAEYQGDLKANRFGSLTFGLRNETEYSQTSQTPDQGDDNFNASSTRQTTNSVFLQDRITLNDRLDLTLGGRVDAIVDGKTFETWRSTVTYQLDPARTKLRASVGTGAKAPSLFQRFSQFGSSGLSPETSFGYDIGFDHVIGEGAGNLSVTFFDVEYQDKIAYRYGYEDPVSGKYIICVESCYYNLGMVHSRGLEFAVDYEIVPSLWQIKLEYSFIDAYDFDRKAQMYRVPRNKGSISISYTGIKNLRIETRAVIVGERIDVDGYGGDVTIPSYVRFDLNNLYKVNEENDAYVRFENLTDAHTEDAYNFGSAGRSVYVGWTTRW